MYPDCNELWRGLSRRRHGQDVYKDERQAATTSMSASASEDQLYWCKLLLWKLGNITSLFPSVVNGWEKKGAYLWLLFALPRTPLVLDTLCIKKNPSQVPANHNLYRIRQTAPYSARFNDHKSPLSRNARKQKHHFRKKHFILSHEP